MGIFDRAKSSLSERFSGDETIRRGKFNARDEEGSEELAEEMPVREEPRSKRVPRVRPPRASKPSRRLAEPEDSSDDELEVDSVDSYDFIEPTPAAIDRDQLADLSKDEGQSVGEILKSMKISETFTIDEGILFLDEELANQEFATQAPYGYDMGEVDFFLIKTQRSVAEYVKLLRLRNDHVVKLATRVSDLMVELNNLRFNSEVANGINIMSTGGDDDALAVEAQEARSLAARLQEQLNGLLAQGAPKVQDQNELRDLRNELAAERIARAAFEKEAQDLRAHLVLIEEENDIEVFTDRGELQQPTTSGYEHYQEQRDSGFQSVAGSDRAERELYAEEAGYQKVGRDHWLPGLDQEESFPIEDVLPEEPLEDYDEQSLEELSLDSFANSEGGFSQSNDDFDGSAFTPNPYQDIDEFLESNLDGFPDDASSGAPDGTLGNDNDPDEDGFQYEFERRL